MLQEAPFTFWDGKAFYGLVPDMLRVIGHRENISFAMYLVSEPVAQGPSRGGPAQGWMDSGPDPGV